jgi:hypothetical protein
MAIIVNLWEIGKEPKDSETLIAVNRNRTDPEKKFLLPRG